MTDPCQQVENICAAKEQIHQLTINQTNIFERIGQLEQGSASRTRQLDIIQDDVRSLKDTVYKLEQTDATRTVVIQAIKDSILSMSEQMVNMQRSINTVQNDNLARANMIVTIEKDTKDVSTALDKLYLSVDAIKSTIDKAHGGIQFFVWFFGASMAIAATLSWIIKPFFTHVFKAS